MHSLPFIASTDDQHHDHATLVQMCAVVMANQRLTFFYANNISQTSKRVTMFSDKNNKFTIPNSPVP